MEDRAQLLPAAGDVLEREAQGERVRGDVDAREPRGPHLLPQCGEEHPDLVPLQAHSGFDEIVGELPYDLEQEFLGRHILRIEVVAREQERHEDLLAVSAVAQFPAHLLELGRLARATMAREQSGDRALGAGVACERTDQQRLGVGAVRVNLALAVDVELGLVGRQRPQRVELPRELADIDHTAISCSTGFSPYQASPAASS